MPILSITNISYDWVAVTHWAFADDIHGWSFRLEIIMGLYMRFMVMKDLWLNEWVGFGFVFIFVVLFGYYFGIIIKAIIAFIFINCY